MKEGTKRTTINLDTETTAALDEIIERTGSTKTNALTQAIHAEARRLRRKDEFDSWFQQFCDDFDITITDDDESWASAKMDEIQGVPR